MNIKTKIKEKLNKLLSPHKTRIYIYSTLITIIVILSATIYLAQQYNEWSNHWRLIIRSPIVNPIEIEPIVNPLPHTSRSPLIKEVHAQVVDPRTLSVEEYIKYVFGDQGNIALAVSLAENHTHECTRTHVNKDHSVDIGVMQINSVHLNQFSLRQLTDCHGNIDAAYKLYKAQGWGIWSTYTNGSYKKYLNQ